MRSLVNALPQYDYCYLGDNARSPYGSRSFETVYRYTLQCVQWLLNKGCPLVILACNTASAKALRSIQQKDLPGIDPTVRVLGVIRPTTEVIGRYTKTGHVGILATQGTVQSDSYRIECEKFFPQLQIEQEACPMWVPLVENNEHEAPGANYFVRQHVSSILSRDEKIDTLLLACTHYPLLKDKIEAVLPTGITLLTQGEIVADSLLDYLGRHPEIEQRIGRTGVRGFFTTDSEEQFDSKASVFFGEAVRSTGIEL